MKKWKTLSKETILSTNKFLTVEKHSVPLPDGQVINDWQWVITPSFSNIVAVTDENKFLVINQYKYSLDDETLSTVGGYIEPGEDPLQSAKRELMEETGYEAKEWISLGSFMVDSNRGCGTANLFLATGATKISEPNHGDLEEQEVLLLSREQIESAIETGEFKSLSWITNLLFAFRILDQAE
jgi:ADP-ribose pyrophosphatase